MPTKKISELTAITTETGADTFIIVQGGVTYRATRAKNASKGADIASAATTDIGAATGEYVEVTGTVTITAFGTVAAGTRRIVRFTGALTLTHNATSLILKTGADIITAADDIGEFISLGSGNWFCKEFSRKDGTSLNLNFANATTATGTDTYAATLAPAIAAYTTSRLYFITFTNANLLTTSTINLNALGAKTIKKEGSIALVVGDIPAAHAAILKYDGTNMILLNPAKPTNAGITPTIQVLAATGTWTKPANCKQIKVTLIGGGGGGAAGDSQASGACGSGGGGGGGAIKYIDVTSIASVAVTIGGGGAGGSVSGASGFAGSTTAWGAVFSATAGAGGTFPSPGGLGGLGASGDINWTGSVGGNALGLVAAAGNGIGFNGGSSFMGSGGQGKSGVGGDGKPHGGGGAGGGGGTNYGLGGTGAAGICMVEEYY